MTTDTMRPDQLATFRHAAALLTAHRHTDTHRMTELLSTPAPAGHDRLVIALINIAADALDAHPEDHHLNRTINGLAAQHQQSNASNE